MENPVYGSGQHSHEVPSVVGVVVEMRDGNHKGTAIWRRDHDDFPFVFASFDTYSVSFAERCVLVVGQDAEALSEIGGVYALDLDTPRGIALIGCDRNEDLSWFSEGAEVLWDSKEA